MLLHQPDQQDEGRFSPRVTSVFGVLFTRMFFLILFLVRNPEDEEQLCGS